MANVTYPTGWTAKLEGARDESLVDPSSMPLKDFDEGQLGYVLRLVMARLHASQSTPNVSLHTRRFEEVAYGTQLAVGFGDGLFKGVQLRYAVMRDDFRRDYALIQKLFSAEFFVAAGKGLAASFDEFFIRPLFEEVPAGLQPESALAAQRLIEMFSAMKLLDTIGLIDNISKAGQFFALIGAGFEEVLEILEMEGQSWASSVVLEHDALRQGAMIGEAVGMALFEIVRIVLEPPTLDAAHLISSLALTGAEQQALGL